MSERTRFHPVAIFVDWLKNIRNYVLFIVYAFFKEDVWGTLLVLAGLMLLSAVVAFVKYYSQSYQITSDKLVLYKGVLNRKEIDIPYERIQTIKKKQWFFFKPLGVIQLMIETAGGQDNQAEAVFPAVKEEVLAQIKEKQHPAILASSKTTEYSLTEDHFPKKQRVSFSYRVSHQQILLFSITDLSMIAILIALVGFSENFIPEKWLTTLTNYTNQLVTANIWVAVGLVLFALIFLSIASILRNFIRYYHFQTSRLEHSLLIEKGLFERNEQTIPIEKIQGIKIKQQVLRKLLGLVSVELLLAGGQGEDESGENDASFYLLPIIREKELPLVFASLLPEWELTTADIHYTSRGQWWYFLRWYLLAFPVFLLTVYYFNWFALLIPLLVAIGVLSSGLDCHYQGYALIDQNILCTQHYEFLTLTRTYIHRNKIQAFCQRTTPWLYRKGLGHFELWLRVGTLPSSIQLKFVQQEVLAKMTDFYQGQSVKK